MTKSTLSDQLILHLKDDEITSQQDAAIRNLLFICFKKPILLEQRHIRVVPKQRFFLYPYENEQTLVGHIAVHEKVVHVIQDDSIVEIPVGVIAEVAVHPDWQRKGLMSHLLNEVHRSLREQTLDFSLLFGAARHYASSGYQSYKEAVRYLKEPSDLTSWETNTDTGLMIASLTDKSWPAGAIDFCGPKL